MASDREKPDRSEFSRQLETELTRNILPFWMARAVDRENGGFYGAVTNDLQVHNEVPRSAILCARILWTYAAAFRKYGDERYLETARWAHDALRRVFFDRQFGGLYWSVDMHGAPVMDRKHHYAQAFGIYGLSEYYRATGEAHSLAMAQGIFHLLEQHAHDPRYEGYTEGSSRKWENLPDMRLSDKDLYCQKSMNTMLHMLEAYTGLLRVWDDPDLRASHRSLIETFLDRIVDPQTGHFKLFFDSAWKSLSNTVSFGHDIEGSWLLCEAAEVQGDAALASQVCQAALRLAESTLREGLDPDGSLLYEAGPEGIKDADKEWWGQAEALVGFYNAYQLSGDERYAEAAARVWAYIRAKVVDRTHGDWFKRLRRDGTPNPDSYKVGPWECPYHHSRACLEMIARLDVQPAA